MKGLMSYIQGIGFTNIRPAIYAWFFNFLFSLFIFFGSYELFSKTLGQTRLAESIYGNLSIFTFFTDIYRGNNNSISLLVFLGIMTIILFIVTSIFTAGGIYLVFLEKERSSFINLIASSLENFFNMCKIFIVNILNWILAILIPGLILLVFFNIKSPNLSDTILHIFTYIWLGIVVFTFTFSVVIYDFSRIFRLREEQNCFKSFKKAIHFTFSNKLQILIVFFIYWISLGILFLIYTVLIQFLENLLYAILLFFLYQVFIIIRYFLKVIVMRAEIKLVENTD